MSQKLIAVKIPYEWEPALKEIAKRKDLTLSQMVRHSLKAEIDHLNLCEQSPRFESETKNGGNHE